MKTLNSTRMTGRLIACGVVFGVVVGFTGCQPQPNVEGQNEESHEHFPAHWPYTVSRASARLAELVSNPKEVSKEHSVAPRDEFVDLVNWLPILAADSDLDRATFDRIDAWSTRSVSQWQRPNSPRQLDLLVQEAETQEMIAWLVEVCQQEELRLEQLK
jgi:hypothetical protein